MGAKRCGRCLLYSPCTSPIQPSADRAMLFGYQFRTGVSPHANRKQKSPRSLSVAASRPPQSLATVEGWIAWQPQRELTRCRRLTRVSVSVEDDGSKQTTYRQPLCACKPCSARCQPVQGQPFIQNIIRPGGPEAISIRNIPARRQGSSTYAQSLGRVLAAEGACILGCAWSSAVRPTRPAIKSSSHTVLGN